MPVSIRLVSGKVAMTSIYKSTISVNNLKHMERVENMMISQNAYRNAAIISENCREK